MNTKTNLKVSFTNINTGQLSQNSDDKRSAKLPKLQIPNTATSSGLTQKEQSTGKSGGSDTKK